MILGTKEWAEKTVNCVQGCEHNCRYCYARYNAVYRFKTIESVNDWPRMKVNQKKVNAHYGRFPGTVMFPSTHDITPSILEECLIVLRKLLEAGNQVLIVSKPHFECIKVICGVFEQYRRQIRFRFTIGSMSDDVLGFWELNAPCYKERLDCLIYAYTKRFSTSVSTEPFLGGHVKRLYETLKPWITESFWIGKLNDFEHRVDLSGVSDIENKLYVKPLLAAQTNEAIKRLYADMDGLPLVRWKDSIREIITS